MPTVLLLKRFRFFFYSNENNEPEHVHVKKASAEGKLWLTPKLQVAYLHGFSNSDERELMQIGESNSELFKQKWDEYFGQ